MRSATLSFECNRFQLSVLAIWINVFLDTSHCKSNFLQFDIKFSLYRVQNMGKIRYLEAPNAFI